MKKVAKLYFFFGILTLGILAIGILNALSVSPVLYYTFEEGSGTTTADQTTNGNNGVLLNGPVWTSSGKFGKAISFDGVNDYLNAGNGATINSQNEITLMAWVKSTKSGVSQIIFSKDVVTAPGMQYYLRIQKGGGVRFGIKTGNVTNVLTTVDNTTLINNWYHIAGSYDGFQLRIYVNGAQVGSPVPATGSMNNNGGVLTIGARQDLALPFKGALDDMKIFDRALTASEIQQEYLGTLFVNDTTLPLVTMTAPFDGSIVSGIETVSANATDNVAVAGVQFLLDGNNLSSEDTKMPYSVSWDTTTVSNGIHSLSAIARDTSSNFATAISISVTVNNSNSTNQNPNIVINPGFESGSAGWAKSNASGRLVTSSQSHSGVFSQQMTVGKEVYQEIMVNEGVAYDVNGWVKTSGVGGIGSQLILVWLNNAGLPDVPPSANILRSDVVGTIGGSQNWVNVFGTFNSPSNSVLVRFYLKTNSDPDQSGTAWFDDLTLNQVNPSNTSINDTVPPNVSIVSPIDGRVVFGNLTIWADPIDNVAVAGVQFLLDGNNLGSEDTTNPYLITLDSNTLSDGYHSFVAVARDTSNNTATTPTTMSIINNSVYAKKYNFVIILTDDQRADTMQYMPLTNFSIGKNSVKFEKALVTTPICCPSRATIFSGLYAHNHGVLHNVPPTGGAPVFDDNSTIATWLDQMGYRTGLFGKYLNAYEYLNGGQYIPPGWDDWHAFVEIFRGKGAAPYYNYTMNNNGILNEEGDQPGNYSTDVILNKTLQFIQSTSPNEPFFIYFAPHSPHPPAPPAPQDIGLFSNISAWRPPSFNEADVSDKPAWVRSIPLMSSTKISKNDNFRKSQLESLQAVDRSVASIVNELNVTGRLNDTVIIFTSDNGMSWGEHRWTDKLCVYEECIKVPFWVWNSSMQERIDNTNLVANIDIAPTLADLAGFIPPKKVNGRSFVKLLTNYGTPWRSELLIEYYNATGATPNTFKAVHMLQYVYAEYPNGDRELYDLAVDPYQMDNKINDTFYSSLISTLQNSLNRLKSE